jgi:predicted nucleic acid-binding Zn ribbon protein
MRVAPRPLSTAVEALTATLAPATMLARVQEIWEAAAGPAIASSARPTAERRGVLTVTCAASVWAQELDLMSIASCAARPAERLAGDRAGGRSR